MRKYVVVGLGVLTLIGLGILIKRYRDFDTSMQDILGNAFNDGVGDRNNWGM
jgi:hypothetical protein